MCSCTMINCLQKDFLLYSERFVVNIDSNDFEKAGYKADILSTQQYFHNDRLNASELGT